MVFSHKCIWEAKNGQLIGLICAQTKTKQLFLTFNIANMFFVTHMQVYISQDLPLWSYQTLRGWFHDHLAPNTQQPAAPGPAPLFYGQNKSFCEHSTGLEWQSRTRTIRRVTLPTWQIITHPHLLRSILQGEQQLCVHCYTIFKIRNMIAHFHLEPLIGVMCDAEYQ